MAISFNTGATANGGGTSASSLGITIPAGVLVNDVILLVVEDFSSGTTPGISLSSTGGAFTQIGSTQIGGGGASGFNSAGAIYYRVATAADPGATVTATATGTGGQNFWAIALAAYTGARTPSPVDVSGGANAAASPLNFPALTTGIAGDWAIYLEAFGESTNGTFTGPSGTTTRETTENGGVGAGIWDSNGSVGGAGTGIGGSSFQFSSTSATVWLDGFTVGLAPPSVPDTQVQPRIPHPLWWQL